MIQEFRFGKNVKMQVDNQGSKQLVLLFKYSWDLISIQIFLTPLNIFFLKITCKIIKHLQKSKSKIQINESFDFEEECIQNKKNAQIIDIQLDVDVNLSGALFSQSNFKLNTNQIKNLAPVFLQNFFWLLMSDIDTLTKNLTQIVGNLMTMIQKSNTQSLIPLSQGIKKTSDMTYHDFLEKVLKNRQPLPVLAKKQAYGLQQDLELLIALSSYSQITVKTFEQITAKKRINRTSQSLRARYHEHLFKIQQKEMKQIVNWIERFGVHGYLTFEQNQLRITDSDLKDKTDDKKRVRPASLEQQSKKGEKKAASKIKSVPTNCKQLNEVLRIYSKMVNIPVKDLLEKLDKLSGDLVALDNYIESKDDRLLWSFQEDEILRKGGAEVQILRKYRGNGIEIRKRYLGIN